MSVRGQKTGNGTYEFDSYMRVADTRTKWQIFKDFLYNPQDGTVFGHTKKRWGIVGLFYLVFYSVLAMLCAICMAGLMATIDDHKPKYTLSGSLIGTNPGLGFRPISEHTEQKSLIWYNPANSTEIMQWVSRLDLFLKKYLNKSELDKGGSNQVICDYTSLPQEGKACAVDFDNWGPCIPRNSYGFNNSTPCIFIKLNKIFDWVPEYYNSTEDLPADMPEDLKEHIKIIDSSMRNTVWVSCRGENPFDRENIGPLKYYSNNAKARGFAGYYYPYRNQPEYLSPVVAVHLLRPAVNVAIQIECRAWAKNIIYDSHRGEKTGSVHFEIMVDKDADKKDSP